MKTKPKTSTPRVRPVPHWHVRGTIELAASTLDMKATDFMPLLDECFVNVYDLAQFKSIKQLQAFANRAAARSGGYVGLLHIKKPSR